MGTTLLEARVHSTEDMKAEIDRLRNLDIGTLKRKWLEFYRIKPPKRMSRIFLMQAVAYKLQENLFGGLSTAHKRKLATSVSEYETSGKINHREKPLYKPGTRLIRDALTDKTLTRGNYGPSSNPARSIFYCSISIS